MLAGVALKLITKIRLYHYPNSNFVQLQMEGNSYNLKIHTFRLSVFFGRSVLVPRSYHLLQFVKMSQRVSQFRLKNHRIFVLFVSLHAGLRHFVCVDKKKYLKKSASFAIVQSHSLIVKVQIFIFASHVALESRTRRQCCIDAQQHP